MDFLTERKLMENARKSTKILKNSEFILLIANLCVYLQKENKYENNCT